MSEQHNDGGHGDSIAAWTAVVIIMIAFTIGTWAVWIRDWNLTIGSAVLAVIGVITGPVLAKLGYGVHGKSKR